MANAHPESNLQIKVAQTVREVVIGPHFFHSADRSKSHSRFGHLREKMRGAVAGFPDTVLIWGGRIVAIELKAPGNEPTPLQRAVGAAIEAAGSHWDWADSVAGYVRILESAGVPLNPRWELIAASRDAMLESAAIRREETKTGKPSPKRFPKPSAARVRKAEKLRGGGEFRF